MATQLFRGDWKKGEVIEIDGKTFISEGSRHYNTREMEEGFDLFMETGYYSTAHEAVSAEDMQIVQAHREHEAAKKAAFEAKLQEAMSGSFEVGQRVRYKNTGAVGTVKEVSVKGMVRVLQDGKKSAGWVEPGYVEAT